jgi:hypothetical protein
MRGHDVGVHHGVDREDSPPLAAGRCLLLPVCVVRLPASGLSGITGTATQRSGQ